MNGNNGSKRSQKVGGDQNAERTKMKRRQPHLALESSRE